MTRPKPKRNEPSRTPPRPIPTALFVAASAAWGLLAVSVGELNSVGKRASEADRPAATGSPRGAGPRNTTSARRPLRSASSSRAAWRPDNAGPADTARVHAAAGTDTGARTTARGDTETRPSPHAPGRAAPALAVTDPPPPPGTLGADHYIEPEVPRPDEPVQATAMDPAAAQHIAGHARLRAAAPSATP